MCESRHLPPAPGEGRSPAVLKDPRREVIQQRQRSPRRNQRQLGGAGAYAVGSFRSRAPYRPWFGKTPQRVAVVLVPSAHDASCRASVAAASALRTIIRAAGVASEPPGNAPGGDLAPKITEAPPFFDKKQSFLGNGAWERVVSKRFAPTDRVLEFSAADNVSLSQQTVDSPNNRRTRTVRDIVCIARGSRGVEATTRDRHANTSTRDIVLRAGARRSRARCFGAPRAASKRHP